MITMEYKVRLTAALPKDGELNGWSSALLAEELGRPRIEQRAEQPRVALVVYGVRNAEVSKDHVVTAVLELLHVRPVQTPEGRRDAERMIADEYAAATGGAMLPYELATLSKVTFADLPRTADQIDEAELAEQDTMSPTDELRRHLERVHGRADAGEMTALEAETQHEADHDGDLPEVLAHARDWIGWTRADIEAATAETDGEEPGDDRGDQDAPDSDLGVDLDDEDAGMTADDDAAVVEFEDEDTIFSEGTH